VRKILIATLIVTATSTLTLAASPPLAVQTGAADNPLVAAPVGVSPLARAAPAGDFATVQALRRRSRM
jgi:hypothetical protein